MSGRYSVRDLLILVEAWCELAWVHGRLSRGGFQTWRSWLQARSKGETTNPSSSLTHIARKVERLSALAEIAACYHLTDMNCLRRTLALKRLLERRGIPTLVHIGTRLNTKGLEGPAWLSWEGEVVNDDPCVLGQFTELPLESWDGGTRFDH